MNISFSRTIQILLAVMSLATISSCSNAHRTPEQEQQNNTDSVIKENKDVNVNPAGPAPEWGSDMKPEMQAVIEKLASLGGKPLEALSAAEARMQPTPADAVMGIMADHDMQIPPPECDTVGKDITVTGAMTHIRIYTPKQQADMYPIIVYYHGGGWVIADINVYNSSAQALCEQANAIVVSVEYPKGPEHKFPAAHTTAFDAYKWVLKNGASIKGDVTKIALVGESAGGNLAANVSIMARDKKIKMPLYQVLVYPVANNDTNSESYAKYAMAKPLNRPLMGWFVKNALTSPAQAGDPRISLVKANLKGLPPTLIIGAEIDPLQTEGKLLSDKLKDANVETEYKLYDGVTHEFFGMAPLVPQAKDAQALAVSRITASFK